MEHFSFVLWMLGFPLVFGINDYLSDIVKLKTGSYKELSQKRKDGAVLIFLCLWIGIGSLVY